MAAEKNAEAAALLAELKAGSLTAFDRFYGQYAELVFKIAYRLTGDRMEAEDICHDVFLEVLHKMDQYDPQRGSLEAWLAVRTRCRALDRLRKNKRITLASAAEDMFGKGETAEAVEDTVIARLQSESVRLAMARLPESQRAVLHDAYIRAFSHRQLSEKLNRPLGTVKSLIRYGLENMRRQLGLTGWKEQRGGANKHEN